METVERQRGIHEQRKERGIQTGLGKEEKKENKQVNLGRK